MHDITVIYYTSNQENGDFESCIRDTLLKTIGDIPLISVSQKPMDFGHNICVGDVGISNQNAHRQFQVGAAEAKTKFVCTAEADFLYPRQYFEFVPERDDIMYRAENLYITWQRGPFYRKNTSEGATVVDRQFIVDAIEKAYEGHGMWRDDHEDKKPSGYRHPFDRANIPFEKFWTDIPVVTFKTGRGMHMRSPFSIKDRADELPYWGNAWELKEKYHARA